jgi:hypothetical protein
VRRSFWWTDKWESWDAFWPGAAFFVGLKPQALSAASSLSALSMVTTHALFARKVQGKLSNGVAAFAADHLWIGKNRGNSRVISTMQIDDHRLREDAAGCWH